MTKSHNFQVGQTVYMPLSRDRPPQATTIVKISRKYASCSNGIKFDLLKQSFDNPYWTGVCSNRVYRSIEDHERQTEVFRLWSHIRINGPLIPHPDVTVNDIREVAKRLRIVLPIDD